MEEAYAYEPTWTVHTDVFEGPLDLLLHLVRREGIDIRRLQVARIADAYVDYLEHLRDLNLSIAGEYLVMAATLVHLKSLELLPRAPTPVDEDAPDPREEFARTLQDYQRVKSAAAALEARPWLGREQHARPAAEGREPDLDASVDVFGLLDIYREMLARGAEPPPTVGFQEEVGPDMGGAAVTLMRMLHEQGGEGELTALLARLTSRAARVVTFIGTLEMARLGWLSLRQRAHLAEVHLRANITPDRMDLAALTGWVEVPA